MDPSPALSRTEDRIASSLDRLAATFARHPHVSGLQLAVRRPGAGWEWRHGAATGSDGAPYFIASITKLYTACLVVLLHNEGALDLDEPAWTYLGERLRGIHVRKGVDSSRRVTVRHLLSNTSGIANYFEDRRRPGGPLVAEALRTDRGWDLEEQLEIVRGLPAHFPPGAPGKAFYSDTNFAILGALVETVEGAPFGESLRRRILEPLGLASTWLFGPDTLDRYDAVTPLVNGRRPVAAPHVLASVGAQGGLVSTVADQLDFLQAFVAGRVVPAQDVAAMQSEWRRIFFPMQYSMGLMRYALPRAMTPLTPVPALVGHAGSTGTLLFAAPGRDLYVAAAINRVGARSLPYRMLARAVTLSLRA